MRSAAGECVLMHRPEIAKLVYYHGGYLVSFEIRYWYNLASFSVWPIESTSR